MKTLLGFAVAVLSILCAWEAAHAQNPAALRVNTVLGMEVTDRGGAPIGEVKELMLDLAGGRVPYAVLELRALRLGEKHFAYPATVLAPGKARGTLVLDVAREDIERSEGFERGRLPASGDEYWSRIDRRYLGRDMPEIAAPDPKAPARSQAERNVRRDAASASTGQSAGDELLRASQFLGMGVLDARGRALGEVSDAIVDLREARLRHVVLRTDRGARTLNVAPSQLAVEPQGRALSLKDVKPR